MHGKAAGDLIPDPAEATTSQKGEELSSARPCETMPTLIC